MTDVLRGPSGPWLAKKLTIVQSTTLPPASSSPIAITVPDARTTDVVLLNVDSAEIAVAAYAYRIPVPGVVYAYGTNLTGAGFTRDVTYHVTLLRFR